MFLSEILLTIFVRIEDNRLGFYFIFSYFPFIFSYFFIERVQDKEDKV